MTVTPLLPLLLGAVCVFILGWPACWALRRLGVIDKPNARSSHAVPTVRGGGVAIILTLLGAMAALAWAAGERGLPLAPVLPSGAAPFISTGVKTRFLCASVGGCVVSPNQT
jgi:UDP-N-acetylmuramyl pentapeptide phosphotransferase/UDP-N-acetylglucosamine-1-phosphate transferase